LVLPASSFSVWEVELNDEFIKTHGYGKAGSYAEIMVADTGIGMDQETLEKIFDPFFTTKEQGKGAGLGMAIVYGIMPKKSGKEACLEIKLSIRR
jgi:signal transduction histidine kinase